MRRNQALASYSLIEGFPERHDLYGIWGFFRSERRCPKCGRCLNTNGKGEFRCPQCEYRDRQDVRKLYRAGLDYNFSHKHNKAGFLFGKGASL